MYTPLDYPPRSFEGHIMYPNNHRIFIKKCPNFLNEPFLLDEHQTRTMDQNINRLKSTKQCHATSLEWSLSAFHWVCVCLHVIISKLHHAVVHVLYMESFQKSSDGIMDLLWKPHFATGCSLFTLETSLWTSLSQRSMSKFPLENSRQSRKYTLHGSIWCKHVSWKHAVSSLCKQQQQQQQ